LLESSAKGEKEENGVRDSKSTESLNLTAALMQMASS